MADETLPQTKDVQKLQVYQGSVPSYLGAVDHAAFIAGLRVTRRVSICGASYPVIYSFYSGSAEQIQAFSIVRHPTEVRFPKNIKRPSNLDTYFIGPDEGHAKLYRTADNSFAVRIRCEIPDASLDGDGIETYEFERESRFFRRVAIGSLEALIARRIAPPERFPPVDQVSGEQEDERTEWGEHNGCLYMLRKVFRLFDGRWAYVEYPAQIEEHSRKLAEAQQPRKLPTVAEWLEHKETFVRAVVESQLADNGASEFQEHGLRYVADPKEMQEIQDALQLIAQRIRNVRVSVQKLAQSNPQARPSIPAESDENFQRFIRKAIGANQDGSNDGGAHT